MRPALLACAALMLMPLPARAQDIPTEVGQCVTVSITMLATRLIGIPDTGTAVQYSNEIFGMSYEDVDAVFDSRVGDKVQLCLESIPEDCPEGDDRGRYYAATNERTGGSWSLPDAEHMCGGA